MSAGRRGAGGSARGPRLASVALALLGACSAPTPDLTGTELVLRVRDPLELRGTAPLRYALSWPHLSADGKSRVPGALMVGGEITTSSVTITVPAPDPADVEEVLPISATRPWGALRRPRVLLYEDVDGDGRPSSPAADRWLSIDGDSEGLGALADVGSTLASLALLDNHLFYQATGGRSSPYVRAIYYSGGPATVQPTWFPDVLLVLRKSGFPEAALTCATVTGGSASSTEIVLDRALDPALCGLSAASCAPTDLAALEPPNLTTSLNSELFRSVECHRRDALAALLIVEHATVCEACSCPSLEHTTAYVTTASTAPMWWPCGHQVPYCPSDLGLIRPDLACLPIAR